MIKTLNRYFFDETVPSLHDVLWFYGSLSTVILIGGGTLVTVWI